MTLLSQVVTSLTLLDIPFALIGASALAAHGISRSTADIDLLTTDRRALDVDTWTLPAASIDVRRGDDEDPLAGVVRLTMAGERDVDLVVGRAAWQSSLVARARPIEIDHARVPVVDAAGLVLLKLYAGGSQDAWDIEQLLAAHSGLVSLVDVEVGVLPQEARDLWARLRHQ